MSKRLQFCRFPRQRFNYKHNFYLLSNHSGRNSFNCQIRAWGTVFHWATEGCFIPKMRASSLCEPANLINLCLSIGQIIVGTLISSSHPFPSLQNNNIRESPNTYMLRIHRLGYTMQASPSTSPRVYLEETK